MPKKRGMMLYLGKLFSLIEQPFDFFKVTETRCILFLMVLLKPTECLF